MGLSFSSSCGPGCRPSPVRRRPGLQQRFAPLGLLDPDSPYTDCPTELAQALEDGATVAKQKIEAALTAGGLAPVVNGWTLTFHIFDYKPRPPWPGHDR